jgi:hypothetical protein
LSEFVAAKLPAAEGVSSVDLKANFDGVNQKLDAAVKSILGEVRRQQRAFSRSIEEKFDEQSAEATRTLQEALRNELTGVLPSSKDRDMVTGRFGELLLHAIHQMGSFQRVNIEQQSAASLSSVEQQVSAAIVDVAKEVKDLKTKVNEFRLALPAATSPADETRGLSTR